jgi:hypothetical protein
VLAELISKLLELAELFFRDADSSLSDLLGPVLGGEDPAALPEDQPVPLPRHLPHCGPSVTGPSMMKTKHTARTTLKFCTTLKCEIGSSKIANDKSENVFVNIFVFFVEKI